MADDKAARKEARNREKQEEKAKRKEETKNLSIGWQYSIGIIVVLGGFICGLGIGWSSPAEKLLVRTENATLEDEKKERPISEEEWPWIASIFALGAAFAQILAVISIRFIGLKYTIILFELLTGCAWIPLMISKNFYVLLFARMGCGLSGGFCVACPMYNGEMAHKTHRGTLGVFFQLFITTGILYTYVLGVTKDLLIMNIACASWCVIAAILTFIFVPESPYILLKKDKTEKATKVMQRLRGKDYDVNKEIEEIKTTVNKNESFKEGIKQKVNLKAFGVLLMLHALQQLSGINAIMYHAEGIFELTGTGIEASISAIIIAVAQVLICLVAAVVVDRSGRVLLFCISLLIMCVTIATVGIFFLMDLGEDIKMGVGLIPTVALVLYICGFSLGAGPLPWSLFGEYLSNNVKVVMSTIIAFFNWMLAFGISWMMPVVMDNYEPYYVFFAFAAVCLLGFFLVLLFVVETNQKTFEQIQEDIASHTIQNPFKKRK